MLIEYCAAAKHIAEASEVPFWAAATSFRRNYFQLRTMTHMRGDLSSTLGHE